MIDTDKLKRLAEAALKHMAAETITDYHASEAAWREFEIASTNPKAILDLIAENERLKAEKEGLYMQLEAVTQNCFRFLSERNDAVELLRESSVMHKDMHEVISGFLARIDAAKNA